MKQLLVIFVALGLTGLAGEKKAQPLKQPAVNALVLEHEEALKEFGLIANDQHDAIMDIIDEIKRLRSRVADLEHGIRADEE